MMHLNVGQDLMTYQPNDVVEYGDHVAHIFGREDGVEELPLFLMRVACHRAGN